MYPRIIIATLLVLVLSACSSATQESIPTEYLQPTVTSTFTAVPPTSTAESQNKATLTPTFGTESNMGTPVPGWEDIPVIPGANEGEPAGFGYIYSVNVTVAEAEQFYMAAMDADGWTLSNRQTSETSMFGGTATILDYVRDGEAVNIMLIFRSTDNFTMVMLTKVK